MHTSSALSPHLVPMAMQSSVSGPMRAWTNRSCWLRQKIVIQTGAKEEWQNTCCTKLQCGNSQISRSFAMRVGHFSALSYFIQHMCHIYVIERQKVMIPWKKRLVWRLSHGKLIVIQKVNWISYSEKLVMTWVHSSSAETRGREPPQQPKLYPERSAALSSMLRK